VHACIYFWSVQDEVGSEEGSPSSDLSEAKQGETNGRLVRRPAERKVRVRHTGRQAAPCPTTSPPRLAAAHQRRQLPVDGAIAVYIKIQNSTNSPREKKEKHYVQNSLWNLGIGALNFSNIIKCYLEVKKQFEIDFLHAHIIFTLTRANLEERTRLYVAYKKVTKY
jgi:hypothetical protein